MAESTLSVTRTDLRKAVAYYAGYGRDPSLWTVDQIAEIAEIVKIGERQFYFPPVMPGERSAHAWSFMRPILRQPLKANVGDYDLPDLFGGFVEPLHFAHNDFAIGSPLREVGIGEILSLREQESNSIGFMSQPDRFAVHPKESEGDDPQRWTLSVWPHSDSDYTLVGPYWLNPFAVSATQPYPMGGAPHAETIRQSCLAAAEITLSDERGNHYMTFLERVAASIAIDRKASSPKSLGYNADRGMTPSALERHRTEEVLYNGTSYANW